MKFFVFLAFCLFPVTAKTFSLMHPEYTTNIKNSELTLNGIIFASSRDWVIWINQQRITPNHIPDWLKIIQVTDQCVKCEYLYNGLWYQLKLEPNDTFTPPIKKEDSLSQE